MSYSCPNCRQQLRDSQCQVHMNGYFVDCPNCSRFAVGRILFLQSQKAGLTDKPHLLRSYIFEHNSTRDEIIWFYQHENVEAAIAKCPASVAEKASRLLTVLVNCTEHFGFVVLALGNDLAKYCYAGNDIELQALFKYLQSLGYLDSFYYDGKFQAVVSANGFTAAEERRLLSPLTVFISSTCNDLVDLRSELTKALEDKGCLVRISEDPEHFSVDPTADTIATCLRNIDSSDLVVCIVDRRYGWLIDKGPYKGRSATHAEIQYTRTLTPPKPVLYFARDRAWNDYELLVGNPATPTRWVEPEREELRAGWLEFVSYVAAFPEHRQASNWITIFHSSVDLKQIVVKRVADYRKQSGN